MKEYRHLVLGGTFDHLHLGHQRFLDKAFSLADHVDIGLVADSAWIENKKFSCEIEPLQIRETALIRYLKLKDYLNRSTIILLKDIYGNTLTAKSLQAILVTKETYKNALSINTLREKNGLKKLNIVVMEIQNDDKEQIISSERIRSGEINRDGFNYFDLFKKPILKLPEELRSVLRQPLGKTYPRLPTLKRNTQDTIITVGDIISQSFVDKDIIPDVRIIDYRSKRRPLSKTKINSNLIINQPGTINKHAVVYLKKVIQDHLLRQNQAIVEIDGEEDLLVLPAVMLLPLGALVYYGQFDIGVVKIRITEEIKEKVKHILELFI